MSVSLSPILNGYQSFLNNGLPNNGGFIYVYLAGGSTLADTYTTNVGDISNANPIPLGAGGRPPNEIWLTNSLSYKFVIQDRHGAQLSVYDNIQGIGSGLAVFIISLLSSIGSSLIGFIQSGLGAILTTVQAELRKTIRTSSYTTFQQAVNAAAGKILLIDSVVTMAAGELMDLGAFSNTTFKGAGGRIVGPVVGLQSQPTAYMKAWGTLGANVLFAAPIAEGTSTFAVANTFSAGDLVMLQNFPTDATDAYTEGGADPFGEKARSYANTSAANLRQTRRKEILVVESATGAGFVTTTGTANAYASTVGLKFQKITPVENLKFIDVIMENVLLNTRYTKDMVFQNCTALSSGIIGQTTYNTTIDFADFDARGTDCRIDFFEGFRLLQGTGTYRNIHSPSDNAVFKLLGGTDFKIKVIAEGCRNSNGVMVDTAFTENPSGFSDLPSSNFQIDVTARGCEGQGVALTCDPFAAKVQNGQVFLSSDDTGCLLKGAENIDLYANIGWQDGSSNSMFFLGAKNVNIFGRQKGAYFNSTVTDPRTGTVQSNTGILRIGASGTASIQPAFVGNLSAPVNNATGDGTEVQIAFNSNVFDNSSNHAAGVLTAPFYGMYDFSITIKLNQVDPATHTTGYIRLNADGTDYYLQPCFGALAAVAGDCALAFSVSVPMTLGSTAKVYLKVGGGAKVVDIQGSALLETFWTGRGTQFI